MERTTLEKFFAGKFLRVPPYQRDYAWTPANVDDLWNDVREALALSTSHYLGTFIVARRRSDDAYDLVDGQQRLTTLTMLISALIRRLPESEVKKRIVAEDQYLIDTSGRYRLVLLGDNDAFFRELLGGGAPPTPRTGGQKRLASAFARITELVKALSDSGPGALTACLGGVARLNVLEFLEEDEGNAIRIFETVNDRGRPLATIDKIKSFLIYTSSRYFRGDLDDALQRRFGRIFRAFDSIKEIGGEELQVELFRRERFTEDTVLQYHFIAYPSKYHDYKFTADDVLTYFLKVAVKELLAGSRMDDLRHLLEDYSEDLARFFESLATIVKRARDEPPYFKLLTALPLSAALYPLTIRLSSMGLLDSPCEGMTAGTFRDAIETADVRVYKTRGTNPTKDMAVLASRARDLMPIEISLELALFIARFMGDIDFTYALRGRIYGENEGLRHILGEFDEAAREGQTGRRATIEELRSLRAKEPTVDHVLAQMPTFTEGATRGFKDEPDYSHQIQRLGNLTLVEKSINSAAQDKTPEQKATEDRLYKASAYPATRLVGIAISSASQVGELFGSDNVESRTKEMLAFCLARWPLLRPKAS